MVNQKKHGRGYPSSFHKSLCLSARVKTSELFERWRNLQVCRWEQNKEETSKIEIVVDGVDERGKKELE